VQSEVMTPPEPSPAKPSVEARTRKLIDVWATEEAVGLTTGKNKKTAETVREDPRRRPRAVRPRPEPDRVDLGRDGGVVLARPACGAG
jgi:hypothetical protein